MIKAIRFLIAVPVAIVNFIIGWGVYLFCLGIGLICLANLIGYFLWWIAFKTGISESMASKEQIRDSLVIQYIPFLMAKEGFLFVMRGFKSSSLGS